MPNVFFHTFSFGAGQTNLSTNLFELARGADKIELFSLWSSCKKANNFIIYLLRLQLRRKCHKRS